MQWNLKSETKKHHETKASRKSKLQNRHQISCQITQNLNANKKRKQTEVNESRMKRTHFSIWERKTMQAYRRNGHKFRLWKQTDWGLLQNRRWRDIQSAHRFAVIWRFQPPISQEMVLILSNEIVFHLHLRKQTQKNVLVAQSCLVVLERDFEPRVGLSAVSVFDRVYGQAAVSDVARRAAFATPCVKQTAWNNDQFVPALLDMLTLMSPGIGFLYTPSLPSFVPVNSYSAQANTNGWPM